MTCCALYFTALKIKHFRRCRLCRPWPLSHHSRRQLGNRADHEGPASAWPPQLSFVMFVVAGCSGPLPNAVPLPLARSSLPVSHHLLHLPEIQSGMENPHPQPIYTSCLTSPVPLVVCFFIPSGVYLYLETVV